MSLTRLGSLRQNVCRDPAVRDRLHKLQAIVQPEAARDMTRWGQDENVFYGRIDNIENFIEGRAWEMANSARAYFGLPLDQGDRYFGTLGR
jgi:hypothetical protein